MENLLPLFASAFRSPLANSAGPYKNSRSGGQAGKYCQKVA